MVKNENWFKKNEPYLSNVFLKARLWFYWLYLPFDLQLQNYPLITAKWGCTKGKIGKIPVFTDQTFFIFRYKSKPAKARGQRSESVQCC